MCKICKKLFSLFFFLKNKLIFLLFVVVVCVCVWSIWLPHRSYAHVVNVFGRLTVDTAPNKQVYGYQRPDAVPAVAESQESVSELSGHPAEQTESRQAKIYIAAKNAMQSGTFQQRRWRIEFDNRERWENPLMGWGSTADPLTSLGMMDFASKEDAQVYCQRMNIPFRVEEPHLINKRIKSYGANFSWNKKTRRDNK